jgi:hypothetical protein
MQETFRCRPAVRMVSSLRVNAEACHLGEIRCRGEVQYVHVVKDVVTVEPAEKEEPRVGEDGGVITSWGGGTTESRPWLVL